MDITDTLIKVAKYMALIAVCAVFMVAINVLIGLLSFAVFGGVIGEVFGIISCCLPFNALFVFGGILTTITGVLAFMIARKIFDLTTWGISTLS